MYKIDRCIFLQTRPKWIGDMLINVNRGCYDWFTTKDEVLKALQEIKEILSKSIVRYKRSRTRVSQLFDLQVENESLIVYFKERKISKNKLLVFSIIERG